MRESYPDGFKKTNSKAARLTVAEQMINDAEKLATDQPAEIYALLSEAASIAAACGGSQLGVRALDLLNEEFEVDYWGLVRSFLVDTAKKATTLKQLDESAACFRQLAIKALNEKRYDDALFLANRTTAITGQLSDADLHERAMLLKNETREIGRLADRAEKARNQINANPDNAKAHADLGSFLCLIENDWTAGLDHWSQSNKTSHQLVARLEQGAADSEDPDKELQLADAWYELGKDKKSYQDARCLGRAKFWYQKAVPKTSGLYLRKIEKQIVEIDKLLSRIPSVLAVQGPIKKVPDSFWQKTWVFEFGDGSFNAKFSRAGTVLVYPKKGGTRVYKWRKIDDEFHVINENDGTTAVFRPRSTGLTVAFEKINSQTKRMLVNGIGRPK